MSQENPSSHVPTLPAAAHYELRRAHPLPSPSLHRCRSYAPACHGRICAKKSFSTAQPIPGCLPHAKSYVPLGLLSFVGSTVGVSLLCVLYSGNELSLCTAPCPTGSSDDPRALSKVTSAEGQVDLEKHTPHQALLAGCSIKSIRPACSIIIQERPPHPQLQLLLPLHGTWEPRGSRGAVQEELQRSAFPSSSPRSLA